MREYVEVVHSLLGGDLIRAELGRVSFKTRNGDFETYNGLVPENIFGHLRERLLVLEALFLKVPKTLDRTLDATLNALVSEFSACVVKPGDHKKYTKGVWDKLVDTALAHSGSPPPPSRSHTGKGKGRNAGKGGKDEGPEIEIVGPEELEALRRGEQDAESEAREMSLPWPRQIACAIARIGWSVQAQLLGGKLISYYTEWCEGTYPHAMGVAHPDTIVLYDVDGVPVTFAKDDKVEHNVYLGCPNNLLTAIDPVLKAEVLGGHRVCDPQPCNSQGAPPASFRS